MTSNYDMVSKTAGSNTWNYTCDFENRLKKASLNGLTEFQALYDGDGRRVQTIEGDSSVYHYLRGSWDPCYVKDLTSGVVTDVVFAGAFRIGKVQGGVNYYYHLDRLGSVRLVTQAPNVRSFTAQYWPFGATIGALTSGSELFQYTGKQLDVATGLWLQYYGYRYYDRTGRFTTMDSAGPNYLNPQTLNRYVYAMNNPNRYTDPDGGMPYDPDAGGRMTAEEYSASKGVEQTREATTPETHNSPNGINYSNIPPGQVTTMNVEPLASAPVYEVSVTNTATGTTTTTETQTTATITIFSLHDNTYQGKLPSTCITPPRFMPHAKVWGPMLNRWYDLFSLGMNVYDENPFGALADLWGLYLGTLGPEYCPDTD